MLNGRAIVFDFGGTLATTRRRPFHSVFSGFSACNDGRIKFLNRWRLTVNETKTEFIDRAQHLFPGHEEAIATRIELWAAERPRINPVCRPVLRKLSKMGYSIGLLTNVAAWDETDLGDMGIARFFAACVSSYAVGTLKPEQRMFYECQLRLGLPPGRICMVGDSFGHDVEGALAAGWKSIFLDSSMPNDLEPQGGAYIAVNNLEACLGAINRMDWGVRQ